MAKPHCRTSHGAGFACVSLIGLAAMSHADDSFAEKASKVLYWHAGEWRTLRGTD